MRIAIESTNQFVDVDASSVRGFKARVWTGVTENGVPVQCLIVRVAVDTNGDLADFDRELQAEHAPGPEPRAFPLRMIL